MKKTILYILLMLIIMAITVSGTYAFFTATNNSQNEFKSDANKFEVIYTGGKVISGPLTLRNSKDENNKTTINIGVTQDSVLGKANIYLKIEEIDEVLATDALIWEVYDTTNETEELIATGDFLKCGETMDQKCKTGDLLYIIKGHQLAVESTSYTIYIWLNGEKATNDVIGAKFKGYIGAESENFTATLK